jgi:hypothetical protein
MKANILEELVNLADELEAPIVAPEEGDKFRYQNILGITFHFEILRRKPDHYEILIEDSKVDILPIDYDLVSMLNDGTFTRLSPSY